MNHEISVEKNPPQGRLTSLGVKHWPIWTKEVSVFDWHYDSKETCYILEGLVEVTAASGESVTFGAGDLVTFPRGLSCTWKVKQAVKKHYNFE